MDDRLTGFILKDLPSAEWGMMRVWRVWYEADVEIGDGARLPKALFAQNHCFSLTKRKNP